MSVEVLTNITSPFEWILEDYGIWNLLSDYTGDETYGYLDNIYHYLVDGIVLDNDFEGKTEEELKAEYNEKFPLLLAEAFENIANDIISGGLKIITKFD